MGHIVHVKQELPIRMGRFSGSAIYTHYFAHLNAMDEHDEVKLPLSAKNLAVDDLTEPKSYVYNFTEVPFTRKSMW